VKGLGERVQGGKSQFLGEKHFKKKRGRSKEKKTIVLRRRPMHRQEDRGIHEGEKESTLLN